ncbi:uncharacterized protein LAESUDRAFT_711405 [Laetiporus sulphureus 93-53]|uniref:F-box domain-containing protein n=1 Tax=Laetiporus sulphureus 93-53 TaxID=1314785 RepID=A0A165GYW3_9APHY|nr:uncharacterized protein LAESUDRAFT_711405 [Laetiporus sulphureus 93-53]KZT11014.1 hypothetical protein LAESUDRAFT_711405 [Laetiporus sulphureus 93-53]
MAAPPLDLPELPEDVLVDVFGHLGTRNDLLNVMLVHRAWYPIAMQLQYADISLSFYQSDMFFSISRGRPLRCLETLSNNDFAARAVRHLTVTGINNDVTCDLVIEILAKTPGLLSLDFQVEKDVLDKGPAKTLQSLAASSQFLPMLSAVNYYDAQSVMLLAQGRPLRTIGLPMPMDHTAFTAITQTLQRPVVPITQLRLSIKLRDLDDIVDAIETICRAFPTIVALTLTFKLSEVGSTSWERVKDVLRRTGPSLTTLRSLEVFSLVIFPETVDRNLEYAKQTKRICEMIVKYVPQLRRVEFRWLGWTIDQGEWKLVPPEEMLRQVDYWLYKKTRSKSYEACGPVGVIARTKLRRNLEYSFLYTEFLAYTTSIEDCALDCLSPPATRGVMKQTPTFLDLLSPTRELPVHPVLFTALMLHNHRKQSGTTVHPQQEAGQHAASSNPLLSFRFNTIGQEPSLLKRFKMSDEDLQYPDSPSPPSSLKPTLPGDARSSLTDHHRVAMDERTVQPTTVPTHEEDDSPMEVDVAPVAASQSQKAAGKMVASSTHNVFPVSPVSSTSHSLHVAPQFAYQFHLALPRQSSPNTPLAPIRLPPEGEASGSQVPPEPHVATVAALPSSPTALIELMSQATSELSQWSEIDVLVARYRDEHQEFLHRNQESQRALQREKEQAVKMCTTVDAVFARAQALCTTRQQRLQAKQDDAKRSLDAQRAAEQRRQEDAAVEAQRELEMRGKVAEQNCPAQAQRRAQEEMSRRAEENAAQEAEAKHGEANAAEARHRVEAIEAQQEELGRQISNQEQENAVAELQRAEKTRELEEKGRQETLSKAEEEAQLMAEDEQRKAEYEAKRAEIAELKRQVIERERENAIAARAQRQEGKKPRPDIKARLEKEKKAVKSRPPTAAKTASSDVVSNESAQNVPDSKDVPQGRALSGDVMPSAAASPSVHANSSPALVDVLIGSEAKASGKKAKGRKSSAPSTGPQSEPLLKVDESTSIAQAASTIISEEGDPHSRDVLPVQGAREGSINAHAERVSRPAHGTCVDEKMGRKLSLVSANADARSPLTVKQEQPIDDASLTANISQPEPLVSLASRTPKLPILADQSQPAVNADVRHNQPVNPDVKSSDRVYNPAAGTASVDAPVDDTSTTTQFSLTAMSSRDMQPVSQSISPSVRLLERISHNVNTGPHSTFNDQTAEAEGWINRPSAPDLNLHGRGASTVEARPTTRSIFDRRSPPPQHSASRQRGRDRHPLYSDRSAVQRGRPQERSRKHDRDDGMERSSDGPPARRPRYSPPEEQQYRPIAPAGSITYLQASTYAGPLRSRHEALPPSDRQYDDAHYGPEYAPYSAPYDGRDDVYQSQSNGQHYEQSYQPSSQLVSSDLGRMHPAIRNYDDPGASHTASSSRYQSTAHDDRFQPDLLARMGPNAQAPSILSRNVARGPRTPPHPMQNVHDSLPRRPETSIARGRGRQRPPLSRLMRGNDLESRLS